MKIWKISFQYWMIVFVDHSAGITIPVSDDRNWTETDDSDLGGALSMLTDGHRDVWVWCHQGLRRVVQFMMDKHIFIKATGGIVQRPSGERLLINRNGKWDMAKGKVEPGESLRTAALREVTEETGLHVLSTERLWAKTYHIYDLYGGWHLKQTSWYVMPYDGNESFLPQEEEGITCAEWVAPDVWRERLSKSFSMLKLVSTLE